MESYSLRGTQKALRHRNDRVEANGAKGERVGLPRRWLRHGRVLVRRGFVRFHCSAGELPEARVAGNELVELTDVDDPAAVEKHDAIRLSDGGEAMSDDDHRTVM